MVRHLTPATRHEIGRSEMFYPANLLA